MIVEYIRYALAEHDGDELVAAYARAAEYLAASPNALAWELTRCADDPKSYILRIEWDSAAGHMQGFRKSEHFPGFYAAIRPFVPEIAEMRHYEPTGVASA
jgi:heme-degrading monooxygenase HmoA